MFSVYRKELKLYFRIKSTYILLTVLLATVGILTAIFAPVGGLQFIPVYLAPVTFAVLPLSQIFADRRQKRTHFEDCYFAMGISPLSLTVGRFLAALTVFLIPVLELALLPLLFCAMGSVALGSVYTSILGYILLIALLLAMEQALLAVLPKSRLGAVLAYLPPVLLYLYQFLITLLPLGENFLAVLTAINPVGLFYAFTYGRFPIADLVALLAGIVLFLLLCTLLCKHRRGDFALPSRRRAATVLVAVSLVLALALSMGMAFIPDRLVNPSVRKSPTFEIVAESADYLKKLKDDVTVYYLVDGGKKSADRDMQYFLYDLADLSPHLRVEIVNTAKETDLLARYGAASLSDQSMVVVSGERHLLLDNADLYHYYNADLQVSLTPVQYAYYLSAYTNYLQTQSFGQYGEQAVAYGAQLYSSQTTVAYFDGCARLTNAIHYVTSEDVPTAKIYGSKDAMDASLKAYLISGGYYFEEIASPTQIGSDCDLLILHTPKTDITDAEAIALSSYLENGGKVFLITSCLYSDMPNLHSVTREFGLDVLSVKNIVCEQDSQYHYSTERPDYFLAHIAPCDISKNFDGYFAVMTAHAIKIEETAPSGVTVFPLLYTGETTGSLIVVYENGEEGEESGEQYVTAAVAQKGEGTLVWLASPESASATGYSLSAGGNFTFIREAMNWMTENAYAAVNVSSTLMTAGNLPLGENGAVILGIVLALVLPLALLIPSMVYLYKRNKR